MRARRPPVTRWSLSPAWRRRVLAGTAAVAIVAASPVPHRADLGATAAASAPVQYTLSFPEPDQRWMQVEVLFVELPSGVVELRMSRTSPGRYAVHEFAKNVFDVSVADGSGRVVEPLRPNAHQWDVPAHDGTVRVRYKVFGDTLDGTYLAVDATHAHVNAPAALMWARGLWDRPARVTLLPPPGAAWRAATQLMPTEDPLRFTAPNFDYLMDSPIELGDFAMRTLTVPSPGGGEPATIRVALHHLGTDQQLDEYVEGVRAIVREQAAIFGELPRFEPGHYTFLVDYLPWARGDGMEHRNSTVITSAGSLATSGPALLGTVAHEFFHVWNVERIRPRSLEPFDFEEATPSPDLWLAEGFTTYYGTLTTIRAGTRMGPMDPARAFEPIVRDVVVGSGLRFRSPVEMSLLAPLVDGAQPGDRTNLTYTFLSYYTAGAAIAMALDLSLRALAPPRSLDDVMRILWERFGRPGGGQPGRVSRPYTLADVTSAIADVAGDPSFAGAFTQRFVLGRERADYRALLARAGIDVRLALPGSAWLGLPGLDFTPAGARLLAMPQPGTPAAEAGLGEDDLVLEVEGRRVRGPRDLESALAKKRIGERVRLRIDRRGNDASVVVPLQQDPEIVLVPIEKGGGPLTPAQRGFRESWLGSRVRH